MRSLPAGWQHYGEVWMSVWKYAGLSVCLQMSVCLHWILTCIYVEDLCGDSACFLGCVSAYLSLSSLKIALESSQLYTWHLSLFLVSRFLVSVLNQPAGCTVAEGSTRRFLPHLDNVPQLQALVTA